MSIQIIDNFSIGVEKSIDNRFVVGPGEFYTNRDDIQKKYVGLRIWDINDDKAYVWKGSNWEEDSASSSGLIGPGTNGKISKFTSPTTIGDSIIEEENGIITVRGTLSANSLSGIGTNITSINASNITNGVLNIARIQGENNRIIVGQGLGESSSWVNLLNVTVGNSIKINLQNTTDSSVHYLTMGKAPSKTASIGLNSLLPSSTSQDIYTNNLLKYYPSDGFLSIGDTQNTAPLTRLYLKGTQHDGDFNSGVLLIEQDNNNYRMFIDGNDIDTENSNLYLNDYSKNDIIMGGNVGIGTSPTEKLEVAGNAVFEGSLRFTGLSQATNSGGNFLVKDSSNNILTTTGGVVPVGAIIMWSGSNIPTGWTLCNGVDVNGENVPDLADKFIVGTGKEYSIGDIGGSKDAVVVSHTHTMPTSGSHTHSFSQELGSSGQDETQNRPSGSDNNPTGVSAWNKSISGGSHTHPINTTGVTGANKNLPPYFALAFIMYVGV